MRRSLVLALLGAVMLYFALIAAAEYALGADVRMSDDEGAACVCRGECSIVTQSWLREFAKAAIRLGVERGVTQCPKIPTT